MAVAKDPARYPSPVRVKGSHHSTTRCVVAEADTVLDITDFDRILAVDVLNGYNRISLFLLRMLRARATCPHHQIIRYAETVGFASYTFSI